MPNESPFPGLERWMIQNPDAARELSVSTRERYLSGGLPAPLLWFLRNPGALEALAKDARKLGAEEIDEVQAQIEARSQKQRKYRAEQVEEVAPEPRRRKAS